VSIAAGVKMKDLQVSMLLEENFLIPVNLIYTDGNAFFFSYFVFQFTTNKLTTCVVNG